MSGRRVLNFLQISLLLLVLLVVGLTAAAVTMHFVIHGAEVQVPNLKGMTVEDARSQAAGLGLSLDVDNRYYSGDVPAGHILTQSPTPGTMVRRAWQMRVSESLGAQTVDVPNTVGKEERQAELELRRAGLGLGTVVHLPVAGVTAETVLAQDPPAKAQGIDQPTIHLLLAAPNDQAADGYLMPDMTGMLLQSALSELSRVGIKSAPPKYVSVAMPPIRFGAPPPRPPSQPGTIISQQPPVGARVDQSTLVKLTVTR